MESLVADGSFGCANESGIDTETDTENSSYVLEASRDMSHMGFFNQSDIDEFSFPEHRAVAIPRDNYSYICAADSEDETEELQISGRTQSDIISDQDLRFHREMREMLNKDVPAIPAGEIVDDSCVAVFHEISGESAPAELLTFNGIIPQQQAAIHVNIDECDLLNNTSTSILDSSQASLQIDLSADRGKSKRALYTSQNSPNILFDSDAESEDAHEAQIDLSLVNQSYHEDSVWERERKILKRLQNALAGVLPPPSITKSAFSVEALLSKYLRNSAGCGIKNDDINTHLETLMKPLNSTQEAKDAMWPAAFGTFAHGIHYNRSKYSEKIETMCLRYAQRSIGSETGSSFVKCGSPSSSKKRYMREKALTQSPGRRLSHLAKRKAIFSCANLQKINLSQPSGSRQILLGPNARKSRLRIRTPKRLSPQQPKSREKPKVPLTRETSKRALFQSPPQQAVPPVTPEYAERVGRSRRALFSSPKLTRYASFQSSSGFSSFSQGSGLTAAALANRENYLDDDELGGKRKRCGDTNDVDGMKKMRLDGTFGRSQSFTAEYVARQNALLATRTTLCKSTSDVGVKNCLTDLEKQKLFYIVSQTLQRKQITGQHERFKEYATVMAKVVKRLFLEYNRRTFGSVSEQMSKMANSILFDVLQGKSVDEIYASERRKKDSAKITKPSGYVPLESYSLQRKSMSFMSENSGISSLRFSQSESSQGFLDTALRENVDSEQRQKSGQKGLFSGKDQKNVSPHKSSNKKQKLVGGKNLTNLLKAKRQISFDT